jgi:ABC-type polysaccharide/polyol phosphate export permease
MRWSGDYLFTLQNLVLKDFRIRYRNMSLGVFWSLLNPLVMMAVFTFVFSQIFNREIKHYPVYLLCGLVPWNFFSLAWPSGTYSLVENAALIRRTSLPRELIPITSVLSNCLHLGIQIALLLVAVVAYGLPINVYWLWLPIIWALEVIFVCGLALIFSPATVFVRDTRYLVESSITILFWLVPVFYSFSMIPDKYKEIYQFNPVAALVMASRNVLLEGHAPATSLLLKLTFVSFASFAVGWFTFHRAKERLYDYL